MAREPFANIRIVNKIVPKIGPQSLCVPFEEILDIFEVAEKYKAANQETVIVEGK